MQLYYDGYFFHKIEDDVEFKTVDIVIKYIAKVTESYENLVSDQGDMSLNEHIKIYDTINDVSEEIKLYESIDYWMH